MECCIPACPMPFNDCSSGYFRFPRDPIQRQAWITAIWPLKDGPTVKDSMSVCRKHFKENEITKSIAGDRYCLVDARSIPSLYLKPVNFVQVEKIVDPLMLPETVKIELETKKSTTAFRTIDPTDKLTNIHHLTKKLERMTEKLRVERRRSKTLRQKVLRQKKTMEDLRAKLASSSP